MNAVSDLPTARSPERERMRLSVVLTTIAVAVVGVIAFSFAPGLRGQSAAGIGLLNNAILIGAAVRHRDAVLGRLLLFGLIVGIVELAADAWLVDVTRTLDYSISGSAMVWRSPWWMVMAWEVVSLQFAYIGLRLSDRWGLRGVALSGLIGAVNIPFYEEMALRLQWWRYAGAAMLAHTPWFIIVGEFSLVMGFGLVAPAVRRRSLRAVLLAGLAAGVGIWASYAGAWYLLRALAP